jgi:4-amino-4-deoxy-L-arabinose transferase-like glycosyltransferase
MYPLIDSTEARYGEIARIMIESNNWVTPQFDYGIPFWGKPPLHTWASAISGELFGVSEFSLRLPHLLTSVFTLLFVGLFAVRLRLSRTVATLVLCSSLGFFVASGMIMTDSLLLLGMTMAMTGFFIAWRDGIKASAYIGFVGIGIGLLAKGPIILILIGLAVVPWVFLNYGLINGIKTFYKRIPIFSGLVLTCLVALPWYILAESATPGFLNYFLVGEHFLRFVQSGWEGDLYGTAHSEPRGVIWLYWLVVAFPWSFYLGVLLFSKSNRHKLINNRQTTAETDNLTSYLICWLVSPLILFTLSGNILPIYVLPGIPALAILLAKLQERVNFALVLTSLLTPLAMVTFLVVSLPSMSVNKSDKFMLAEINLSYPLYYLGKRSFSGRFYSNGKAIGIESLIELDPLKLPFYVAIKDTINYQNDMQFNCEIVSQNERRKLLLCRT